MRLAPAIMVVLVLVILLLVGAGTMLADRKSVRVRDRMMQLELEITKELGLRDVRVRFDQGATGRWILSVRAGIPRPRESWQTYEWDELLIPYVGKWWDRFPEEFGVVKWKLYRAGESEPVVDLRFDRPEEKAG
jgi:hypothetical protein